MFRNTGNESNFAQLFVSSSDVSVMNVSCPVHSTLLTELLQQFSKCQQPNVVAAAAATHLFVKYLL